MKNFVRPVILISARSISVNKIVSPIIYLHNPETVLINNIYSSPSSTSENRFTGASCTTDPSEAINWGSKGTNSKKIGRASCRERKEISGGRGAEKKKKRE